jgi:acyl-CoA synthetase (AMP-forming)/AMP-acid ligase II
MCVLLAKHPLVDQYDLKHVRVLGVSGAWHVFVCHRYLRFGKVGAAPLMDGITQALKKRLPHVDIGQGYGLTGMSCVMLPQSLMRLFMQVFRDNNRGVRFILPRTERQRTPLFGRCPPQQLQGKDRRPYHRS